MAAPATATLGLNSEGEESDLTPTSDDVSEADEEHEVTTAADSGSVPVDDEAFETLSAEIRDVEVLAELAQDKSMDAFRGEYEKLFAALEKSHKNEKRLNTKCQELMSEIANQQARVDAAQDKSCEDQDTIASLRKEIDKAWKMVDMTQEREERARETIEHLNTEIQNLTKVIEEKTLGAEDTNINELRKLRDELTAQRDSLRTEVAELREKFKSVEEERNELKAERNKLDTKVASLSSDLQSRTNEMNREIRRKERTEREVKQLKQELEEKSTEIEGLRSTAANIQVSLDQAEANLAEQRALNSSLQARLEGLQANTMELQGQVDSGAANCNQLEEELAQRAADVAAAEEGQARLKAELQRAGKELDESRKWCERAERAKAEVDADRVRLKEEMNDLRKEIKELKHAQLVSKRRIDERSGEVTGLEHSLKRAHTATAKQQKETRIASEAAAEGRRQLTMLDKELEKQKRCIATIEEERDQYLREAQAMAKRVDMLLEDIRDAEAVVFDYRKEVTEMETKLKAQQNLYQAARNDRTILNKSLTESQDSISDLKGKLRVLQHQFDQLKEEMVSKEASLAKEGQEQQKLIKEKEDLQAEVEKCRAETEKVREQNAESEREYRRVRDQQRQLQTDYEKAKGQLETTLSQRSRLDHRLSKVKKNKELLERKVAIQEKVMNRGEGQYRERIEDIRVLKLEIKRLKQEETLLLKGTNSVEDMKKEILQLQKDLLHEKSKVRSLQSEMESPMNVHRWRKLEGNDPSSFELIQKVQALQKRLLAKKEELVKKNLALQEQDKLNNDLRSALERQPGIEVISELMDLKIESKKRKEEVQGMRAENLMYKEQVLTAEKKVELMSEELHEAKRKLLDRTKQWQKLKEEIKRRNSIEYDDLEEDLIKESKSSRPQTAPHVRSVLVRSSSWSGRRFTGGGFNFSPKF